MPLEAILILVVIGAYFAVFITALLIHGIWVATFIERHGFPTAGFVAHWMLGTGVIRDYLTARRLCKQMGIRPRWMKWFSLVLLAVAVVASGIVAFILTVFAKG